MHIRLTGSFIVALFSFCSWNAFAEESYIPMPEPITKPSKEMFANDIKELKEESSPLSRFTPEAVELSTTSSQCFPIKQVIIHNQYAFTSPTFQHELAKWQKQLIAEDCHYQTLLEQDINILNAILHDAGYITSEVGNVDLFADQKIFEITLNAGRVEDIVAEEGSKKRYLISQAMPIKKGDVVNIYDIEQGSANLRSRPNSNAKITLKSGVDENKNTIIAINEVGDRTFNGVLSIDNNENEAYGDLFGKARFGFGNLFQLNDSLTMIFSSNLDTMKSQGVKKQIFSFQIPYQYWRFTLFGYNIETKNKVSKDIAGSQNIKQQHLSFEAQRKFRLSQQRTVTLTGGLQYYTYNNRILGQTISVHERRSPYITAGIKQNYRFMRGGSLNTAFNYKQSIPLKGARLSPIESVNGVPIFNFDIDAIIPFNIASQHLFYQPDISIQLTKSAIDGLLDKSTIGGLSSVYGFSTNNGYSAANQFVLRQRISWLTPIKDQLLFSALDYGSVSDERKDVFYNKKQFLVGAAIGLEGNIKQFSYQFSWGIPILMPEAKERTVSQIAFKAQLDF